MDEDIKALAVLLHEIRSAGADAERKLHPEPEAAVVTLIEIIDGLQKKLSAAQDEVATLQSPPVTPSP